MPTLEGIPLWVLGNKLDLDVEEKLSVDQLIERLDLKSMSDHEISCCGTSAKEKTNLDMVLQCLVARAASKHGFRRLLNKVPILSKSSEVPALPEVDAKATDSAAIALPQEEGSHGQVAPDHRTFQSPSYR
jgi:hypothetical protein